MTRLWTVFALVVIMVALAAFVGFGMSVPQSSVGGALFRVRYAVSGDRSVLLKQYAELFSGSAPKYLPKNADEFLCKLFKTSSVREEKEAVTDFYVRLAGGREGTCFIGLGEQAANYLHDRIGAYAELGMQRNALILLEEVRVGKPLFKPQLFPVEDERSIAQAVRHYKKWIESPTTWDQKRLINPLESAGLSWQSP